MPEIKTKNKKWLRPALFILGGAGAGLAYYYLAGCAGGSCAIASDPLLSMLYLGVVGWLVSEIFKKEETAPCNT